LKKNLYAKLSSQFDERNLQDEFQHLRPIIGQGFVEEEEEDDAEEEDRLCLKQRGKGIHCHHLLC
jgi:hypothetical protein